MSTARCCHISALLLIGGLVVAEARGVGMDAFLHMGSALKPVDKDCVQGQLEPSASLALLFHALNPSAAFTLPNQGASSPVLLARRNGLFACSAPTRRTSQQSVTLSDAQRSRISATTWKTPILRANVRLTAIQASTKKTTAVYALILANLAVFLADNLLHLPFFRKLYLWHTGWEWWQPFTACFCHGSRAHLSGNMFLLLLFGRSVEDDLGRGGLLFSFAFCGIVANLISLALLPSNTVSLGASGAVFGLFAVSTLTKLSLRNFDWRNVVELVVLGEFVFGKIMTEIATATTGGIQGINHVAHLSGATAGAAMILLLRTTLAKMESREKKQLGKNS